MQIIYAPKDEIDLQNILYTASLGLKNPIAIRYPRGRGVLNDFKLQMTHFKFQEIYLGSKMRSHSRYPSQWLSHTINN